MSMKPGATIIRAHQWFACGQRADKLPMPRCAPRRCPHRRRTRRARAVYDVAVAMTRIVLYAGRVARRYQDAGRASAPAARKIDCRCSWPGASLQYLSTRRAYVARIGKMLRIRVHALARVDHDGIGTFIAFMAMPEFLRLPAPDIRVSSSPTWRMSASHIVQ